MKSNGKLLLKIVSAFFMIFGVIAAIVTFIALIRPTGTGTGWLISTIILLLASVAEFITGFVGLKKSDDHSQANFFITIGFMLAVLELASIIAYFSVWALIGFIVAILYITGGYMLRNSKTE
jgi:hypothetical protein